MGLRRRWRPSTGPSIKPSSPAAPSTAATSPGPPEVAMNWRRRLAVRLGLDGNSLRRRTDRIAVYGTVGLLVVFLVVAPILAISVGHWAYRWSMNQQQHQRSWREVTAVLLQKAPIDPGSYDASGSWTLARWTPPGGHARDGVIPAPAGKPAGSRVRIWLDA